MVAQSLYGTNSISSLRHFYISLIGLLKPVNLRGDQIYLSAAGITVGGGGHGIGSKKNFFTVVTNCYWKKNCCFYTLSTG